MRATDLCKVWGVQAKHAYYRKTGDWFHRLKTFPGALLDAEGFVLFETEEDYITCPYLRITLATHPITRISDIPGYVRVVVDGERRSVPTGVSRFYEGGRIQVIMSRHERDPKARTACLNHYGTTCTVCSMSFGNRYGALAEGIIHVHHLNPFHGTDEQREVDPVKDLRPVCPNCHAVLHRQRPPYSIEEVKAMLR